MSGIQSRVPQMLECKCFHRMLLPDSSSASAVPNGIDETDINMTVTIDVCTGEQVGSDAEMAQLDVAE